ncbi:lipid A oxidase [Cognatiyoonia koreensis]|uniref:Lipid A oxidase n=2 Tax=Cognatiyoonia koreensis TaxID=364200 RepID=A0A1I0RRW8_9RHOB|nr:lipid A oxidase [Cognatiyoonia koreensis]
MRFTTTTFLACLICAPVAAVAEVELSFYGGAQSAPHSDVIISGDDVIPSDDYFIGWEGRSFEPPPYYGLRATVWNSPTFGYGLDFTHTKIYPQEGDLPDGFDRLEFTDGLNTLTVNAYRRWQNQWGNVTPYVGGGVGVAIPHVEVEYEGAEETAGYQLTGPAATWIAGASYPINDDWSVFGEYKGTYSMNTADLDSGGTLETNVITNALNVGVSFRF